MGMRQALLIASGLITLASYTSMVPVCAQGYANKRPAVDTSHLQPVEFFHYRPIVSIEDEGAIVNDHRRRPARKKLIVPVPPLEEEGAEQATPAGAVPVGGNIYVMPGGGGRGLSSPSNPMLGDRFLEEAGPRSYVHQHPITAGRDLPSGVTTGVHANMRAPSAVAPNAGVPRGFAAPKRAASAPSAPVAAVYRDSAGSVGGSTSSQVRTSTAIKMLNRIK